MKENIYFDITIFTSLALIIILEILLIAQLKINENSIGILWPPILLLGLGGFFIFYGSFIEPRLILTKKSTIKINGDMSKIRLVLISDLHMGPYKKTAYLERVVQKLLALRPDIALLGGDYIFGNNPEREIQYLAPLGKIATSIPTFAVAGNHEYNINQNNNFSKFYNASPLIKKFYQNIGVNYLENEAALIKIKNKKFWLVGIDSIWAKFDNLKQALKNTDKRYPKIVLAHNPDIIKKITAQGYDIDLALVGHTHGGQIRLPLIGSLARIPTKLGRKYDQGLFRVQNIPIFITSGIGESGTRARLFNPPEIAFLEIAL